MATVDTTSLEWKGTKHSLYNCSICLEDFIKPKLIPCGHTFCESCLGNLPIKQNPFKKTLQCPECRAIVDLPDSGSVDDFPTNFVIIGVIESTLVQNLCSRHKKSQDLFCVTCDKCICVECFEQAHKSGDSHVVHDVTSATIPANKRMQRLRLIAEKLQNSQHKEFLEKLSTIEKKHTHDVAHIIEEINEQKQRMIDEIQQQAHDLVKAAEIFAKHKNENLEDIKNTLEKEHSEKIGRAKMCLSLADEISDNGLSQSRYEKSESLIHSEREARKSDAESLEFSVEQLDKVSNFMEFYKNPENDYIVIGKLIQQSTAAQSSERTYTKPSLQTIVQNKIRRVLYSK